MKNNYVLTKEVIEEENVSKGGIILLPEKYNRRCIVVKSSGSNVNEGDTIIKSIGKGTIFKIDGEEYEIIHENNILGILEYGTET
jgi:co-chaperonin GroES (HSP10)